MGQYQRVEEVLRATTKPLALHQLHDAIRSRFNKFDSEAAISARIREIRAHLERTGGGTVLTEPVPGKAYLRYWIHEQATSREQGRLFTE